MYDLIVLGAGPAGYVGALRAAQAQLKVLLIEQDSLGGTCLQRGCIPTKSLINDALLYKQAKNSSVLEGTEALGISLPKMIVRKNRVVKALVTGINSLLKAGGIELLMGQGQLVARGVVQVCLPDGTVQEFTAKNILLATGSRPQVLPFVPVDGDLVQTTDQILFCESCPQKLAILGGGVIGIEMATLFAALGKDVTIFEVLPSILMNEDEEVQRLTHDVLRKQKVKIQTNTKVIAVLKGADSITIQYVKADASRDMLGTDSQNPVESMVFDRLLSATGRLPNTSGLEGAGLEFKGHFVRVNAQYQTNLSGVYAVGDVIGGMMLAHKASAEAEAAIAAIMGHKFEVGIIPSCIWGPLEIGSVGLTEAAAKARGEPLRIASFPYQASGSARAKEKTTGFVKIIGHDLTGQVLGVHIIGERATDLIGAAVTVMARQGVVEDFFAAVHPHPTLAELMAEAALFWAGKPVHMGGSPRHC